MTPTQAIKAWCLDCSGGVRAEVRLCPRTDCPLYPFRQGHNPNINRKGNPNAFKNLRNNTALFEEEGDKIEDS